MQQIHNLITRMNCLLNTVTWQMQSLLLCTVFWIVTVASSIPFSEGGIGALTLNQCLEDFGVFLLFFAVWCGLFAHFQKSITLPWLMLLLAVALWQEEVNLLNKTYQTINLWFDREIDSSERQRGDVTVLMLVSLSLLARFFRPGFKSFFRIHISAFLLLYTLFQLWLHYTFPYQIQSAILEPQLNYQKEFTSTYEGRFQYQCDQGQWTCYSWEGDNIPSKLLQDEGLVQVIKSHAGVVMNTTGYIGTLSVPNDSVFRGVDAAQKYLITYFKNHDLNRVVIDHESPREAALVVTRPLVIFSTAFGMVWFFGGMMIVFMHQSRRSRASK